MLKHLNIRNFAIIDELELDIDTGMTVLTGETGAGKSILLGALNLVLGDRADSDNIKHDCDHAEVVAEFDISNMQDVSSWLVSQELNIDDECMLRRRIAKDGRSRAYINGTPVNLQLIRELSEMLIDIHGQHEHQSIMKSAVQRQVLDDYAGHSGLLEEVSNLYVELKLVDEQLQHLRASTEEKNDRLELLRFQTSELDSLALEEGEYSALNESHRRLANAEKIFSTVKQAIQTLSEDDANNIQSSLSHLLNALGEISDVDPSLKAVHEMLNDALLQIDECVSSLQSYGDDIDLDPAQLESVESRIQIILDLARKHRVEPEQLHQHHQELSKELDDIDHADEKLEQLQSQIAELELRYSKACDRLSDSRRQAAEKLDESITSSMQTLGMAGGCFKIEIEQITDRRTAHGLDRIEYTVSANSGSNCKAIAKVASGGELARISLAIQMMIAANSRIPTLVFDEVDSGVGGRIAEIVGQHLRSLGASRENNQVICITHLPQVASQAHNHLRVEKHTHNKQTTSQVITLDSEQQRQEIARMLSGVEVTDQSLRHADEMIERAQGS